MSLLGIDIGITGCKAVAFNLQGKILAQAYREYPLLHPHPDWAELDVHLVWRRIQEIIKEVAEQTKSDPIQALSICSQGEAYTPVDRNGNLMANTPICFDNRAETFTHWLDEKLGRERIMQITGQPLSPMFSLSKILWLKKNHPEIYHKTWKFLCYEDLVIYKLGLEPTTDYTIAARTLCFDILKKNWSEEILQLTNIDVHKFPRVVPSGTLVGTIPAPVARELSLPDNVAVVTGGHDHPCGTLGAGVRKESVALESIGTVDCIAVVFKEPRLGNIMLKNGFPCYPHTIPEFYTTLAFNFTGGSLLRWFRDNLGKEEIDMARREGRDVYSVLIEKGGSAISPLFVLPHLTSSGTPYMDIQSAGAILGLSFNTTKGNIIRGILEGIALEMKLNLSILEKAQIPVKEIRAIGGGAKSREWLQMRADIYNTRIVSLNVSEAACLGAAILAGWGAGLFSSVDEAIKSTVREKEVFYPRPEKNELYQKKFEIYQQIYPALKNLNHQIKQFQQEI